MTPFKHLVLVDGTDLRMGIEEIFSIGDHGVDTARNIEEAKELAEKNSYRIAVIDISLNDSLFLQALEFAKSIRTRHPTMGLIIITDFGSVEIAQKAFNLDADYYLKKPTDVSVVARAILRLIGKKDRGVSAKPYS